MSTAMRMKGMPKAQEIADDLRKLHSNAKYIGKADTGETLRDRFAMAALTGLIAAPDSSIVPADRFANWAYNYADAMLAERNKGKK